MPYVNKGCMRYFLVTFVSAEGSVGRCFTKLSGTNAWPSQKAILEWEKNLNAEHPQHAPNLVTGFHEIAAT